MKVLCNQEAALCLLYKSNLFSYAYFISFILATADVCSVDQLKIKKDTVRL